MKQKNKRYYGMTVSQIGILVGAGVFGLLVVGGLFIFILTSSSSPQAQLPVATEITLPTLTSAPVVSAADETPTPTAAPVIATSVPPGGWVEFKTQGATIWLPPSFVGGDMVSGRQETINKISRLGKIYRNVVDNLKTADKEIVLAMVDKVVEQTDIITVASVQHIISTEDTDLDQYIKEYFNGDAGGTPIAMLITVNETKKMTLLGHEAKRLTYSTFYAGHGETGFLYYIKAGANIWIINFSFAQKDYVDLLPIIEQSIQTFNLTE